MSQTIEEKNKELVLQAFDALFNKRDYGRPSDTGHLATSSTALISNLVAMAYSTSSKYAADSKYEPREIVAEKDFVMVHGRFSGFGHRELDCGGHRSHRGWSSGGALGRD